MRWILLLVVSVLFTTLNAQPPKPYPSSEIFQKIKKLNVLGSVLYIAAHPDDENTRLIAFLSNDRLYRTAYLSMTRGDGGQNLIGDEQGVALGLIRTQELLSARRIDGGEQFFTRAYDFGYSKSPEETFEIWNKEKILSDVVWVIRKYRPDVIITRFPTTGEGGHGHHTASAILAGEAFDAAADTTKFPEQFKYGVSTWRPRRLLWNTFNFGSVNTTSKNQFSVNVGGYNPLLGESYGEIAAHSRSQHKSQGFGVPSSRGEQLEYFKTIKGDVPDSTLMDGVVTSWSRIGHPEIESAINAIENSFSFGQPEKSVPALVSLFNQISSLPEGNWKNEKLKEVKQLIKDCSGLFMEVVSGNPFLVPGENISLSFNADNRLGVSVNVTSVSIQNKNFFLYKKLPSDENIREPMRVLLNPATPISQPYWLEYPMTKGSFTVHNQELIGKPENDPLSCEVQLDFSGTKINYDIPIQYKSNDPVKGEVYQPVYVIPAVEVKPDRIMALSVGNKPVLVRTDITLNDSAYSEGRVREKFDGLISSDKKIGQNSYSNKSGNNVSDTIHFYYVAKSDTFDHYKILISYPHIPDIVYFPKSDTRLVSVDLKTSGKTAGYIPGAGDKIPDALQQMGYSVTVLSPNDFNAKSLSKYDVIVTGVRAYNIHGWLNDVHTALMDYVKGGGVLFVQYNTNNNIGRVKGQIGPYPFQISRSRVTDEDAAVKFTNPKNLLLHYPNEITQNDFSNWIQERSTYHAQGFESKYHPLLSMHDPGETSQDGSVIYADYGKGRFVYCGLVFFRELPEGVPGAFRLFANLIAKPQTKK